MKNLAGVKDCDKSIQIELTKANCPVESVLPNNTEVPYSLIGKIGKWTLLRAWYYWVAVAEEGNGIPLDLAKLMYSKKYPSEMFEDCNYQIYGEAIRVGGDCTCKAPEECVDHYDINGKNLIIDIDGSKEAHWDIIIVKNTQFSIQMKEAKEKYEFVKNLDACVKSVIDSYHIDTQEGLNEFIRVVTSLK